MGTTISVDIHSPDITLDALQSELKKNPMRLEERREGNNTLLISSTESGNLAVCTFLLSVGANVEAKNLV